jgi:2-methylisocitrate lyase-like PEP mutase family enzyme
MTDLALNAKARTFRALHDGPVLVLPNAWDAASAALIARAGAAAVATTSGGVSWALGRPDGQGLTRAELVDMVRRVARSVDVPVTVDVEGGYGPDPADVAETIRAVIGAGAVGVNLEDSRPDGTLWTVDAQAHRVRAAREAAGLPDFFLNVRTDVFLFGVGAPAGRLDDVLARTEGYAKAGADGVFVPGLLDLDTLAALTAASPLPVNAMAGPGGPSVADLAAAGVRRVSVGTAIAQAAYAVAWRATRELLDGGTYEELDGAVSYPDLNALFTRPNG